METVRPCGCKGIRSCLLCESEYKIVKVNLKTRFEVRFLKIFTNKACYYIKLGVSLFINIDFDYSYKKFKLFTFYLIYQN